MRLRVLQSEELDAASVLLTVRENRLRDLALVHDAIVLRPEMDVVDGIPFMTWDETAGWTLDTMLARVRAFGIRIPAEYALLIAERLAAALEHAQSAAAPDRPSSTAFSGPGSSPSRTTRPCAWAASASPARSCPRSAGRA